MCICGKNCKLWNRLPCVSPVQTQGYGLLISRLAVTVVNLEQAAADAGSTRCPIGYAREQRSRRYLLWRSVEPFG